MVNPVHSDKTKQSIDVRLYFDKNISREFLLHEIRNALKGSWLMADLHSAYELVNDGFAHLTPSDEPLA
jgi:hypothetical protein